MDAILIIRVQPVISNTDKEDKLLYVDGILRKLLYVLRFENSQWNSQIENSRLQSVLNLRHSQFPAELILSSTSLWPQQAELFCKICKKLKISVFLICMLFLQMGGAGVLRGAQTYTSHSTQTLNIVRIPKRSFKPYKHCS